MVIAAMFGVIGYWLTKHDFEPAPLLLAFVLGPLMEENLRRAMLIARGDATVFFTRPLSSGLTKIISASTQPWKPGSRFSLQPASSAASAIAAKNLVVIRDEVMSSSVRQK